MKGLLIKDFCLLRNQNRTVPIFLVLAVWFAVMNQITFCISFLTMMSAILAMSTCSYDELDNCQTTCLPCLSTGKPTQPGNSSSVSSCWWRPWRSRFSAAWAVSWLCTM